MLIFGWNEPQVNNYGPVKQHTCPNCHNTKYWQLSKISRYFTLFFVPIFAHGRDLWYYCPVCSKGTKLDQQTFDHYKLIADVNTAFGENRISKEERMARLAAIDPTLADGSAGEVKIIG